MIQHPDFTAEEEQWLGRILLTALDVRCREHFFGWIQGPVQTLLPHDILICGFQDHTGSFRIERFSASRYFRAEHLEAAVHPHGLLAETLKQWQSDSQPVLLGHEYVGGPANEDGGDGRLRRLELRNLATHALRWIDGSLKCHVSFARVMCPFDGRLSRTVQVLAPVVSMTLARVLASEGSVGRTDNMLSPREIEILEGVRDGRTNPEIAVRLNISPLTVKNHIRHILKKLQVRTRGHAVAKALSAGLLNPHFGATYASAADSLGQSEPMTAES
ncbi:MAG: transcriptional regulator EpsA [Hydrogenophilaceae bacterium]|nr:transcriptional regulator EpsA [Hydrogenophilaceae bacterium]